VVRGREIGGEGGGAELAVSVNDHRYPGDLEYEKEQTVKQADVLLTGLLLVIDTWR